METAQKRSLDITNAEHIGYRHGGVEITVLGGVRLEGLDRMRTTLKIQVEEVVYCQSFPYHSAQTEVPHIIRLK